MNWKTILVIILLALGAYAGYRYWHKHQVRNDFCLQMQRCSPEAIFNDEFVSIEECASSENGSATMELFSDCELQQDCDAWLECGYGLGANSYKRGMGEKRGTNFDEVSDYL